MSFNFRVLRIIHPEHKILGVVVEHQFREVYYDDETGNITGWTQDALVLSTDDGVAGLQWQLERLTEALGKPVLEEFGETLREVSE